MRPSTFRGLAALLLAGSLLAACGDRPKSKAEGDDHAAAAADFERGPHRGRLLRDGDFAVEITIFEDGAPPEFHAYVYRKDKPIDPRQVQLSVELTRLGGKVDRFAFAPVEDYLRGAGVVVEPHSFDVKIRAVEGGRTHQWAYASYEGRTSISAEAAKAGGVRTEIAGPATISELVDMAGRVEIVPEGMAEVRAVYPGRILMMRGELGQSVRKGQAMARVESSHSLQAYAITAPISGVITEKNANVGGVAGDQPLFVVADPTKLHAEFFVYPRDAERVRVGQPVEVRSLSGEARLTARVEAILPTADLASQTLMAHVHLPPGAATSFRPGMGVEGSFSVGAQSAPLAVRTKALQRFRDFTVVFAKVGNTYEVRMLELGRQTPEWTEVLGGLAPGTEYVVDGAFLIRADIEKSGASHDH
ncbi:MAG: efflux RND transporter periplasmic adaptor subunit [Phenylobacterium sp.]|uniref:efflux RND transporter periplasmic adaptor subunit n=1 Tax=Phenylobacterium sp. TaxID=1871053 RepID=UPI0027281444|nr:efflux RND transporter periplasmic adaptor subunit [Phenylobacterium sp.]MDO8911682.1 efflux RND transporter periplasmic adaptor subunit [Phenylobacterium sp.]MDP2011255.1 efflux RND transporter periplasmic adaptor subunit [Phenylobacterium sp.]MDP3099843.1 efflux RND transporter periplasmic adaptor subunit [Phenylobacterium sp.]MDP3867173.1 efflux RND transporter periplasmic adaptor subunit [Phenylobacterium sp.]HQT53912.1 efflux RND transporter periplasmic adaptor subunit [Phenylobacteriu